MPQACQTSDPGRHPDRTPYVLRSVVDRAMDLTVAPGYSRLGYLAREGAFAALPRMDGQAVLLTGGTSGIGRAAAEGFAGLGAKVLLLARDEGKATTAIGEIAAATGNMDLAFVGGDLASLASVRAAAKAATKASGGALHVLVNNAGVMTQERELSADGFELTFATNVLGPFLLTQLLLGELASGAPARIVTVSSGGMYAQRLDVDDVQSTAGDFKGVAAYAKTKRMELVLSDEWGRRLRERGIVAHAMHPGWVDTPGVQDGLPGFRRVTRPILRDARQGADTIVWLGAADAPAGSTGGFWHDRRERPKHLLPWTRERAGDPARLWELCVKMSGAPTG